MGQSFEYYETTTEVNDDFLRDINVLQGHMVNFLETPKHASKKRWAIDSPSPNRFLLFQRRLQRAQRKPPTAKLFQRQHHTQQVHSTKQLLLVQRYPLSREQD